MMDHLKDQMSIFVFTFFSRGYYFFSVGNFYFLKTKTHLAFSK